MTLGELNYKDTFLGGDELPYAAAMNVLFIIFVLTMPIIMMNMLVRQAIVIQLLLLLLYNVLWFYCYCGYYD